MEGDNEPESWAIFAESLLVDQAYSLFVKIQTNITVQFELIYTVFKNSLETRAKQQQKHWWMPQNY